MRVSETVKTKHKHLKQLTKLPDDYEFYADDFADMKIGDIITYFARNTISNKIDSCESQSRVIGFSFDTDGNLYRVQCLRDGIKNSWVLSDTGCWAKKRVLPVNYFGKKEWCNVPGWR